jgi:hypothetical protein
MTVSKGEARAQYQRLFCGAEAQLQELAMNGGLGSTGLRSVAWKVFLGVLREGAPLSDWKAALGDSRVKYEEYKEKFLVDPYKDGGEKDLITNNPLAQGENSLWKKYFELQELQKDIQIDLERLNFDDPLFAEDGPHFARVQGMMLRILTIWSSLNPAISYRQGMHELLAPLLAVLERDCLQQGPGEGSADSDSALLCCVADKSSVEHDGFALFEHLMAIVSESFAPQERKKGKDGQYERPGGVVARCDCMQNTLLRAKDYELYIHLQSQHIEPQLYSMKWIRLLLGREFHLEDVLVLWDAMFADHHKATSKGAKDRAGGRGLELLEYVCVAMLIYVRNDLVGKDNMECLQRLMKYPPVEDVKVFVASALRLRNSCASSSAPLHQHQQPQHQHQHQHQHQPPKPAGPPPSLAASVVPAVTPHKAPPKPGTGGGGGDAASATLQRAPDKPASGAPGPGSWFLGSSSSSSAAAAAAAGGGGGGGGGVGASTWRGGGGGQVALVDGQVVNVGSTGCGAGAAVAQARLGTSNLAGASANRDSGAETDDGRGGKRIGVEGGRENGVLGAKMTGPMATLEALVAVVPEARQPEMVKALNLLREVQQALGGGGGLGGTTTALLQQGWQQESGSKGNKARVASSSSFPFIHISNSEVARAAPPAPPLTTAGADAAAQDGGARRVDGVGEVAQQVGGEGGAGMLTGVSCAIGSSVSGAAGSGMQADGNGETRMGGGEGKDKQDGEELQGMREIPLSGGGRAGAMAKDKRKSKHYAAGITLEIPDVAPIVPRPDTQGVGGTSAGRLGGTGGGTEASEEAKTLMEGQEEERKREERKRLEERQRGGAAEEAKLKEEEARVEEARLKQVKEEEVKARRAAALSLLLEPVCFPCSPPPPPPRSPFPLFLSPSLSHNPQDDDT